MNRVFVCGDTHGGSDMKKLASAGFPEGKDLDKDDFVIVLGDFGLVWYPQTSPPEQHKYDWLAEKGWTTLFVDGNHENFDRIDRLPTTQMFGSPVGKLTESIYHLRRGYVYNIAGRNFFTFGGGFSIDKARRAEGISWWAREMPNHEEYKRGLANLENVNNEVDYILTHSCSNRMFDELSTKSDLSYKIDGEAQLRKYFDIVDETVKRKMWYYGHFHYDCIFEDHQAMYNLVKEIK